MKAAVRRRGGRLMRQLHILPSGLPDGLEDPALADVPSLPVQVMVYFADPPENLYQLRQWYWVLRQLDRRHRVGVICADSRTATAVRAESGLVTVCVARSATLERLTLASPIVLALYVNHNIYNFDPLRFAGVVHCYIGHGESDKAASASNQVKAYDYVFVSGEAGLERLRRNLLTSTRTAAS